MRAENTLGDHTVHGRDDIRELASAAELHSHATVARKPSGAGKDEIPYSGKSGHCFLATAAGYDQARDFSQAASDQGCDRVMPESQAVANPSGDCNNVFQRAPEFHASHIGISVDAKTRIAEFSLNCFRKLGVCRRDSDCRRITSGYFSGERRTTQRPNPRLKSAV